jgi:hypothetical protein
VEGWKDRRMEKVGKKRQRYTNVKEEGWKNDEILKRRKNRETEE